MLNRFEILALKAATSEKEEASSSWNELMSELSFDEIESSIARILPSIFSNLKNSFFHHTNVEYFYQYIPY
jgi:hypothetical protein